MLVACCCTGERERERERESERVQERENVTLEMDSGAIKFYNEVLQLLFHKKKLPQIFTINHVIVTEA